MGGGNRIRPSKLFKKSVDTHGRVWYNPNYLPKGLFFCAKKYSSINLCREAKITGGAAKMRVKITLACTECKQRNYDTMKNKKNDPDRLEMNKYCRFCRKHTLHKETK